MSNKGKLFNLLQIFHLSQLVSVSCCVFSSFMSFHYVGVMISQLMVLSDKIIDNLMHLLHKTLTVPLPGGGGGRGGSPPKVFFNNFGKN